MLVVYQARAAAHNRVSHCAVHNHVSQALSLGNVCYGVVDRYPCMIGCRTSGRMSNLDLPQRPSLSGPALRQRFMGSDSIQAMKQALGRFSNENEMDMEQYQQNKEQSSDPHGENSGPLPGQRQLPTLSAQIRASFDRSGNEA